MTTPLTNQNQGLAAGFFCFIFWGFAPIYFKLLEAVPASTIIAHRIVWSLFFLVLYLVLRERNNFIESLKITRNQVFGLLLTGILIVSNWLLFVWAVNHDRILDTSLGYFITPLVNVFFGMFFLQEKLSRPQWFSLSIALISTLYFAYSTGTPPWVALLLAASFGLYGFLRKKLNVKPMIGLFWETLLLVLPAIVYLILFTPVEIQTTKYRSELLIISGIITLLPLIGFNYAAKNLPLVWVGFLQYIAPSISFLIAVFVYDEEFSYAYQVTFGGIWLALFIISIASLKNRKDRSA